MGEQMKNLVAALGVETVEGATVHEWSFMPTGAEGEEPPRLPPFTLDLREGEPVEMAFALDDESAALLARVVSPPLATFLVEFQGGRDPLPAWLRWLAGELEAGRESLASVEVAHAADEGEYALTLRLARASK